MSSFKILDGAFIFNFLLAVPTLDFVQRFPLPVFRPSLIAYAIESSKETELDELRKALINKPDTDEIIKLVYHYAKTNEQEIRVNPKGKRQPNAIIAFAMFACRRYGESSQKQIAEAFQLRHPGGSSFSINKIKKEISQGLWEKEIEWLEKQLNIVKSA